MSDQGYYNGARKDKEEINEAVFWSQNFSFKGRAEKTPKRDSNITL